ncbi:MAG: PH domain-containing protein [Candidatus Bathyarchaeia archaeon]
MFREMSQLNKYLRQDEKILWSGKPEIVPFIFSGYAGFSLFGFVWLIFVLIMIMSVPVTGAPSPFMFFAAFFILFGLCIIIGPLTAELLRYKNTEYAITNQRLIAQTGVIGLDTRFVELDKIQEVYVTVGLLDKIYGTGSIIAVTAGYVPVGTPSPHGVLVRPAFRAIKNPYEVQRLLQEAIRGRSSP